jgi:hypothetical protein
VSFRCGLRIETFPSATLVGDHSNRHFKPAFQIVTEEVRTGKVDSKIGTFLVQTKLGDIWVTNSLLNQGGTHAPDNSGSEKRKPLTNQGETIHPRFLVRACRFR